MIWDMGGRVVEDNAVNPGVLCGELMPLLVICRIATGTGKELPDDEDKLDGGG